MTTTSNREPVALPRPTERYASQPITFTREEVRRVNELTRQRLATLGALRVQVAYFRCPWPCTRSQYERIRKLAVDRWIARMAKDNWQLVSRVQVRPDKRRTAHALTGDWFSVPVLDEVEIPVGAAFKKLDLQITRTAVPVDDDP